MSKKKRKVSQVRDDSNVIVFPVRHAPDDDWTHEDAVATFEALDGFTLTADEMIDQPERDPQEIIDDGGYWEWVPVDEGPTVEPAVGLVAYRIDTMCKWTHRHLMEGVPIPQPCCYSVLISTKRLPGPVREHRSWLAPEGSEPS